MIFCGQCGLQLAPGTRRCPRCGTFIEAGVGGVPIEELHTDDPTIAALPQIPPSASRPQYPPYRPAGTGAAQQPLVLRNNGNTGYNGGIQEANTTPNQGPMSPYAPYAGGIPASEQSFVTQRATSNDYATQGAMPPSQAGATYQGLPGTGVDYAGGYPAGPPTPVSARKGGGRIAALLLVLFGLLLMLGALVLFALRQAPSSNTGNGGQQANTGASASVTSSTLTNAEQAKLVIQHYYGDINTHTYQDAYNLRQDEITAGVSYASFTAGYTHTQHDQVIFGNVQLLNDGTVKVFITLHATEDNASGQGTHVTSYQGYYIVGPVNGTWKILKGYLA